MIIEQTLSAGDAESDEVRGIDILQSTGTARLAAASFQVVRVANAGNFAVALEAGILRADGVTIAWDEIATVDQTENEDLFTFTVAGGARYRFRHKSGVDAVVLMV